MKKQKVFIPVSVKKELPPDDNYYHTIDAEGEPNCRTKESFKDFDEISTAFWLKEQEGYFYTKESLEEIIRDAYVAGFDDVPNEWKCEGYILSLNIK